MSDLPNDGRASVTRRSTTHRIPKRLLGLDFSSVPDKTPRGKRGLDILCYFAASRPEEMERLKGSRNSADSMPETFAKFPDLSYGIFQSLPNIVDGEITAEQKGNLTWLFSERMKVPATLTAVLARVLEGRMAYAQIVEEREELKSCGRRGGDHLSHWLADPSTLATRTAVLSALRDERAEAWASMLYDQPAASSSSLSEASASPPPGIPIPDPRSLALETTAQSALALLDGGGETSRNTLDEGPAESSATLSKAPGAWQPRKPWLEDVLNDGDVPAKHDSQKTGGFASLKVSEQR